jgi:hypothetical protein
MQSRNHFSSQSDKSSGFDELSKSCDELNQQMDSGSIPQHEFCKKNLVSKGRKTFPEYRGKEPFCKSFVHDSFGTACYLSDKFELVKSGECVITGYETNEVDKKITAKVPDDIKDHFKFGTIRVTGQKINVVYSDNLNSALRNAIESGASLSTEQVASFVYELGCGQVPDFDRALFAIRNGLAVGGQSPQNIRIPTYLLKVAVENDPSDHDAFKQLYKLIVSKPQNTQSVHLRLERGNDRLNDVVFDLLNSIRPKYEDALVRSSSGAPLESKTGSSVYRPMQWG